MQPETADFLGHVDWDGPGATNERVVLRAPRENRARVIRNQFVCITDVKGATQFLGRTVAGPFFAEPSPDGPVERLNREGDVTAEIEIQGELPRLRPPRDLERSRPRGSVCVD